MLAVDKTLAALLPPKIIDYEDYHAFVRDYFSFKKSQSTKFSYRRFAALSGIKSPNFLQLVMKNERRLSPTMAQSVAKAMKLGRPESDYFVALVKLEHCQNSEEKMSADKERKVAVRKIVTTLVPTEKSEYLSVWYYPLIRELAFLPDFTADAQWVAHKLFGLITPAQAEKAIHTLVNLGLWKIGAHGKIAVTDTFVDTGVESRSYGEINVARIHQENLTAWSKIIDTLPKADRELGLINIPINESKIPELKKRIQQFQDEIIGWLQDESAPTQIVQLGTYMIPITKKKLARSKYSLPLRR